MTSTRLNYPPRQHVHFVGIGGSGMSGIAEVLLNLGYTVSGSDLRLSPVTERLAALGARIFEGHRPENIGDAQVVVTSTAVRGDNPEVLEAHRHKIAVIPRAEMLAELMRLKYGIAVAGAHGKTTTTSMIASLLAHARLDPTFVVGGRVNQAGTSARLGKSDLIVVEADESDRSFLLLAPVIAVVTNIDAEHLDHYADLDDIKNAFVTFLNKVPFYGVAILCADDPHTRDIIPRVHRRVLTYGIETAADLVATEVKLKGWRSEFCLRWGENDLGRFRLRSPGLHNVRDALAALAVGLELNVPVEKLRRGLVKFAGVGRRFEVKAKVGGVTHIDDYGHHPTEIRALLEAARGCGFKRLVVFFQPHRYTRTQHSWQEFLHCFDEADVLVMTEIYPASETPIEGITGAALAEAMSAAGHPQAEFHAEMNDAVEAVLRHLQPGDALLTVGAGSIGKAAEELATRLPAALGVTNAG
ncbi:MAG TPA: UDP-N-acetylmuramate--L-alanine ligase [Candidatus Acidoferrales bacterium]|nr:UDP-N-acetylmuramate--L-alanine ligase [Candidatus Acidoferrales bacterium]